MKSKKTKKALSGSVLALVLCFVMLIGTTFAWFTSSDSTAVNKIQAGELKVDIVDESGNSLENQSLTWQKASGHEGESTLWEPGVTYKTNGFKIKNDGNLALKYNFAINGLNGDSDLLDVIEFSVVKAGETGEAVALDSFVGNLEAGTATEPKTSDIYYIEGTMKTTAGNAYQGKSLEGIGITVYATQDNVEYDSYNNTYDKDAILPDANAVPVADATELANAIANGGSIVLTQDIIASDVVNIAKDVTIYGNGNTITAATGEDRIFNVQETTNNINIKLYNVTMDASSAERGISFYNNSGKITLDIDSCNIIASHYAVNVASNNSDITINVKNSDITGYAAAQTWSANSKLTFENCTLTGVNKWDDSDNNFSTVNVTGDAKKAAITLKNCTIKNTASGTAKQTFFGIAANDATITATGCTFIDNGTTIAKDNVKDYCYFAEGVADTTITVN